MTEQNYLTELLERLQQASSQTEKSAIVAEMAFAQLDPIAATIARRCVILHWFDVDVIQAFVDHDVTDASSGLAQEIATTLADLPFVETLDWGLAYHEQTRAGLLALAVVSRTDFLRKSAALAAPAYLNANTDIATAEALFCLVVAGQQAEAHSLLATLLVAAVKRDDWQRILAIFANIQEAESLSFVERLTMSASHFLVRGIARVDQGDLDTAIGDFDHAISLNPDDAAIYFRRGLTHLNQGNLDDSRADLDRAIALKPDVADFFIGRGIVREAQGDLDAAIDDFAAPSTSTPTTPSPTATAAALASTKAT